jgi:Pyruvate/2-oxoacid:ferredoxin oxidoreductase gamma subunit
MAKPYNLIIAGVGGQGVNSLSQIIHTLCEWQRLPTQGSTFKGGAQRLGSIHTVLRIFPKGTTDHHQYSSQVRKHDLDLMIGLEPWETLRYYSFFSPKTKVFMNTEVSPLFVERYTPARIADPVAAIEGMGLFTVAKNYSILSQQLFGKRRMVNYLLLKEVVEQGALPFLLTDVEKAFAQTLHQKKAGSQVREG